MGAPGIILDGFTISDGNANGNPNIRGQAYGGAMYNYFAVPEVSNCTFSNNSAINGGGAVYNETDFSASVFTNCVFSGNASSSGGGMFNNRASPTVSASTFTGNSADYWGGGMYNDNGSRPFLTDSVFLQNTAMRDGGGLYNDRSSEITLLNTTFLENKAEFSGGGMYNNDHSSATLENCILRNNLAGANAGSHGGAIANVEYSYLTITLSTFTKNYAGSKGGAVYNHESYPVISDSNFYENSAMIGGAIATDKTIIAIFQSLFQGNRSDSYGGAIYNANDPRSFSTITGSKFISNVSGNYGGGIYNYDSSVEVNECAFVENIAGKGGGGIYAKYGSHLTVTNSAFVANQANSNYGGGVYMSVQNHFDLKVINSTFYRNVAGLAGGGIFSVKRSYITNSILWDNIAPDGPELYGSYGSYYLTYVYYNCVKGGKEAIGGNPNNILYYYNIELDPLFVEEADPNGPDDVMATLDDGLNLQAGSPAIDFGTTTETPPIDILGISRPQGYSVDLGAYEFQGR